MCSAHPEVGDASEEVERSGVIEIEQFVTDATAGRATYSKKKHLAEQKV